MKQPKRRTGWRRPVLALIGVYAALAAGVRCFGDRLVFFPQLDRSARQDPPEGALNVVFRAEDGTSLHGWWLERNEAKWTFLVCHGNAGDVGGRRAMFEALGRLGNVFLFDYRGYGRSKGAPDEHGLYADARAAWQFLAADQEVPAGSIVAYGQSLGSGVASRLALEQPIGALVLEAPFTSVPDMADAVLPFPPIGWAMPVRMPTRANVAKSNAPVLVLHGTRDTVVPFEMGWQTYRASRGLRRFVEITGGGHNDLWEEHSEAMAEGIGRFLKEIPASSGR